MDIAASSTALGTAQTQSAVGVTLLRKGMDFEKEQVATLLEGISGVDVSRPQGEQVRIEA
ncbi:MAG: hypothetical protein RL095_361 [Verrucomicrobiota bacterium]|jgi:hypothetical protein